MALYVIGNLSFDLTIFVVFSAVIIFPLFFRNMWIVIGGSGVFAKNMIESSIHTVLLDFHNRGKEYRIPLRDGELRINVQSTFLGNSFIGFSGSTKQKKVVVLKALLAKKFNLIFPRLVIRLNK